MAKVKVDFSVDTENQILYSNWRFRGTIDEESFVEGLLSVHGILDTEPQLEELAAILSCGIPIKISLFPMELHPTWCRSAITHGHLIKQPIVVILFKPAWDVNLEFLGFIIDPTCWDELVKVACLIFLAGVYDVWKLRFPTNSCTIGHLINVQLEVRVLSGWHVQVPDPVGDLVHS